MKVVKAILFDMDHTLCRCMEAYVEATNVFAEFAAGRTGLAREDVDTCVDAAEAERFERKDFAPMAFANMLADVYVKLCNQLGVEAEVEHIETARGHGARVLRYDYPTYDGVIEALRALRKQGIVLGLYSKGDTVFQMSKLVKNGLCEFFTPLNALITPKAKSSEELCSLVRRLGFRPEECAYVGDSLKDDMVPAKEAGVYAVLVAGTRMRLSSFDSASHADVVPDAVVASVAGLEEVLKLDGGARKHNASNIR